MNFYFAPMEGVSGYIYRNAYQKYFHNIDRYFTPFIAPKKNHAMSSKEKNDVLPEHNIGMHVIPQILTNQAEYFLHTASVLSEMGYTEVNLNLGCPSSTVVSKKKGAGFLSEPDRLEHFLDDVTKGLERLNMKLSIKTRLGMRDVDEFADLLDVYNEFPLSELIIHPRLQTDLYNNTPNWEAFRQAVQTSTHRLCYNGDLFTLEAYQTFIEAFPETDTVMFGRGILRNPCLLNQIQQGAEVDYHLIRMFHDDLLDGYTKAFSGDRPVLFKMKELWSHMFSLFPQGETFAKKIRKVERINEYKVIAAQLFDSVSV
ncbi:MAG: tRNA-dihydrouridine synthase family protein [Peptococcaceae bacterium]|nr:tRNA-dihydrouridine synthase family protein [Peptococcaceae bacterium]